MSRHDSHHGARSTGARACLRRAPARRRRRPRAASGRCPRSTVNYNDGNACASVRHGPGDCRLDWRTARPRRDRGAGNLRRRLPPPGAGRPACCRGRSSARCSGDFTWSATVAAALILVALAARAVLGPRPRRFSAPSWPRRADAWRRRSTPAWSSRAASSACSRRSASASRPRACPRAIHGGSSSDGCTASRRSSSSCRSSAALVLMLFELEGLNREATIRRAVHQDRNRHRARPGARAGRSRAAARGRNAASIPGSASTCSTATSSCSGRLSASRRRTRASRSAAASAAPPPPHKATIVVDDVNADPRYLACSLETKSEIVVPILLQGDVLGEIDIDSDRPRRLAMPTACCSRRSPRSSRRACARPRPKQVH